MSSRTSELHADCSSSPAPPQTCFPHSTLPSPSPPSFSFRSTQPLPTRLPSSQNSSRLNGTISLSWSSASSATRRCGVSVQCSRRITSSQSPSSSISTKEVCIVYSSLICPQALIAGDGEALEPTLNRLLGTQSEPFVLLKGASLDTKAVSQWVNIPAS